MELESTPAVGGCCDKSDIVAHCKQIDALQNIDCCDDFAVDGKSSLTEAFTGYSRPNWGCDETAMGSLHVWIAASPENC